MYKVSVVSLGCPKNQVDAEIMLASLSGKTHQVLSGLYVRIGGKERIEVERSEVTFRDLSTEQIKEYVAVCKPLDKAGAYGIQDGYVVASYSGSYDNIVGLPTEKLQKILEEECQ